MNGYKAFWRGKTCVIFAMTSYEAQLGAASVFKAKKLHEVTVIICERGDGSTVTHSTGAVG